MKTPEEIYKACPKLLNIAERLADSEAETAERNKELKTRGSNKRKFPEHFRIVKIHTGRWEEVPGLPKYGKEAFERVLTSVIDTRNPSALVIEVYGGKRKTPNADVYTCYLTKEAEAIEDPDNEAGMRGLGSDLASLKEQVANIAQSGNTLPADSSMALQMKEMEHKFELTTIKMQYEHLLKEKDEEIEELEAEIEDLNEQLSEQDAELGSAADIIAAKEAPKPFTTLLSGVLETAAENFLMHRPKILADMFKLSPEQVRQILAKDEQKQLTPPQANNEASFSEAAPATDDYSSYTPEHAKALKYLQTFAKSLDFEAFKKFYQVCVYCCTNSGNMNEENADKLLAVILSETNN